LKKGKRLSARTDDFMIKKEIADFVDAEKNKMPVKILLRWAVP